MIFIINFDPISHPSELIGTWTNSSNMSYTLDEYGGGKFQEKKDLTTEKICWHVKDNKLIIYHKFKFYELEYNTKENNSSYFIHPKIDTGNAKFTKNADNNLNTSSAENWDKFEDFFSIKSIIDKIIAQ